MLKASYAAPVEGLLFPLAPAAGSGPGASGGSQRRGRWRGRRQGFAALYLGAFCLAVASQLLRLTPVPTWDTIWAEDYGIFLVQALQHPWHLFTPYAGYEQLVPRIFGQVASMLPLPSASLFDAVGGSVLDVCCAFYCYYASEGFIRSRVLRALLVVAILLVGIAPIEVVANPTNSQWYLMCALFFGVLWRPRSRAGKAASALVAFLTTSTNPIALIFAPVLAIRLIVLRRPREHAVTAGYLAGWIPQALVIVSTYGAGTQRITRTATIGQTVPYYFHWVPLRALGWHLSWRLSQVAGWNGATVIIGVVVLAVLGWAMTQGRRAQAFVVLAVLLGFVQTILSATITPIATVSAPTSNWEMASRYTLMPIIALDAAAIVGVDALAARYGGVRAAFSTLMQRLRSRSAPAAARPAVLAPAGLAAFPGPAALSEAVFPGPVVIAGAAAPSETTFPGPAAPSDNAAPATAAAHPSRVPCTGSRRLAVVVAVSALVIGLACTWIPDYRYKTERVGFGYWGPQATWMLKECQNHTVIQVVAWATPTGRGPVDCSRLVP